MSEEKVLTLRGKKAVWAPGGSGPIDPSRLPEGYPYKEIRAVVDLSSETGMVGAALYKVSDDTPENLVAGSTIIIWNQGFGVPVKVAGVNENCAFTEQAYVVVAYADNITFDDFGAPITLPEKGVYFTTIPGKFTVTGVAWDETAIEPVITWDGQPETIHTMAPEFLPAGVGGNDREFIVEVTQDYHGRFSGNKTYEEMLAAAQAGKHLVAYMTTPDGYVWKSVGCQVANVEDVTVVAFLILGASLSMTLTIGCGPNNEWHEVTA